MPENTSNQETDGGPLIDPSGVIKTSEELEASRQAEAKRQEQSYRSLLLESEKRQASAQAVQAKSSVAIVCLTFALLIATLVSGFISFWQFKAADMNARAAMDTLAEMKRNSASGSAETKEMIHEAQTQSRALELSNERNKEQFTESLRNNQASTQAFIANARIELRAYLGPRTWRMEPINTNDSRKPIRALITVLNSGRTIAIVRYKAVAVLQIGESTKTPDFVHTEQWDNASIKGPTPIFPATDQQIPIEVTEANAAQFFEGAREAIRAFMQAHPQATPPPPILWKLPPDPLITAKSGVTAGSITFFGVAELQYEDIFRDRHTTRICGQYDSVNNVFSECAGFPDSAN